jgi:hypothetical protein
VPWHAKSGDALNQAGGVGCHRPTARLHMVASGGPTSCPGGLRGPHCERVVRGTVPSFIICDQGGEKLPCRLPECTGQNVSWWVGEQVPLCEQAAPPECVGRSSAPRARTQLAKRSGGFGVLDACCGAMVLQGEARCLHSTQRAACGHQCINSGAHNIVTQGGVTQRGGAGRACTREVALTWAPARSSARTSSTLVVWAARCMGGVPSCGGGQSQPVSMHADGTIVLREQAQVGAAALNCGWQQYIVKRRHRWLFIGVRVLAL